MIIGSKDVVRLYELYYAKKYSNTSYKFKPTLKAEQTIEKFISYLDNKYKLICIGEHFLTKFFNFQFLRVKDQKFKRFASKDVAGRIQIYDIVGGKAIQYWEKRNIEFDFIIDPYIHAHIELPEISISEEIEKKRFYNSELGLSNCLEKTSLYNHKSQLCILCKHKISCKDLLKNNYSQIYKSRGYAVK